MEDVDEDENKEELVVLGDVGCAAMRAGAALRDAASPTVATAGSMEGMSSGLALGAGGWGGPVVTWRPGGPIWSAALGEGGAGLRSPPSGLGWAGLLQCVRACGLVAAGGNSSRGLHSGAGGFGPGVSGRCAGGVCGSLGGVGVPWGVGPLRQVCVGCRVRGAVRGVQREGLWRACVVFCAAGGLPCRGARGCARWLACVGHRVGSEEGGAGAGVAWGGLGLRSRVLCRCMCPLAAARLCGHL